MPYIEPYDPNSEDDRNAAALADLLMNEYFLAGISTGTVGPPAGQGEEVPGLKDSWDFIGINYYSRHRMAHDQPPDIGGLPPPDAELTLMGYEVYPEGFYSQLVRLKQYGLPVYVTENGISTKDDTQRCRHLLRHLAEMHRALQEGTDIRGYLHWTFVDNFEWAGGLPAVVRDGGHGAQHPEAAAPSQRLPLPRYRPRQRRNRRPAQGVRGVGGITCPRFSTTSKATSSPSPSTGPRS